VTNDLDDEIVDHDRADQLRVMAAPQIDALDDDREDEFQIAEADLIRQLADLERETTQ
jgi:hypothetical protein